MKDKRGDKMMGGRSSDIKISEFISELKDVEPLKPGGEENEGTQQLCPEQECNTYNDQGGKMIRNGFKYLITTDNYFVAPDGEQYRSAYGYADVFNDKDTLGIDTNKGSTNWYVVLSGEADKIIIAGCQVHFAIECNSLSNRFKNTLYKEEHTGLVVSGDKIYEVG